MPPKNAHVRKELYYWLLVLPLRFIPCTNTSNAGGALYASIKDPQWDAVQEGDATMFIQGSDARTKKIKRPAL